MIVLAINFLNNVYNAFKIEKVMIQLTFFIRIENELLTEQVKLRFNNYHVCDFFLLRYIVFINAFSDQPQQTYCRIPVRNLKNVHLGERAKNYFCEYQNVFKIKK